MFRAQTNFFPLCFYVDCLGYVHIIASRSSLKTFKVLEKVSQKTKQEKPLERVGRCTLEALDSWAMLSSWS